MTALNRMGPTRIWKTLEGKNVKTNDGKDLGEIKKISEDYLLLQKGTVHKEEFWIPKYITDAFDGKILWLLLNEEEVRGKYQYGKEPPTSETYAREFENFKGTSHGQKMKSGVDFNENIRVVENYKNIRDLHIAPSSADEGYGLTPEPAEEQIHVEKETERSKENERKEKDEILKPERVDVSEYTAIPIKFASPKTIERPVQPIITESKSKEPKVREIKNSTTSSSPVRLQSSQMTSKTLEVTKEDRRNASSSDTASLSPVRITPEAPSQSVATTPATLANKSTMSSSVSPIRTSREHKETVQKSSVLELGSTNMEGKAVDTTPPNPSTESTAMMVASPTSITQDKEIDKKPVLAEPMTLKAVKDKEEQIIAVSKNNDSNLLALKTPTLPPVFLEETESISTNLHQDSQLAFQDERTEKGNVNSILDYYFNPFLTGMDMWQVWLDMYNEIVTIGIRLGLTWFDLWKLLIPTTAAD